MAQMVNVNFKIDADVKKKMGNRQTSGRKKRPPPQRPGFEMAVRDSIRF